MNMRTAYLVTTLTKNSIVEEQIFKKGKQTFSLINTWERGVLISETIPKSKVVDGNKVATLKNFKFKENEFDYKKKLVLPDDLSDADSKALKKLFKSDDLKSWNLEEYGWSSSKCNYTLIGEFDYKKIPVHQLTLFCSEKELQIFFLTKTQVNQYSKEGLQQSVLDNFPFSVDVTDPVFDERTLLSVNDEEIPDFFNKFKVKYEKALKNEEFPAISKHKKVKKSELEFAIVTENWIKRSWYELIIYEDFDFSKLKIYISRDNIFGSDSYVETFALNYGDLAFEFQENYGVNSSETLELTL
jgi:hypothetical protein